MDHLVGKQLGRYPIKEMLNVGGMGAIYVAYHPDLKTDVAIKILPRHFAKDPQFVARFRQEAEAAAKLHHPFILSVRDYGEAEGYHYLVMRLVESRKTLANYLLGKPLSTPQILKVIEQIGSALDYAHSKGVIHRDVKPSNILVANPDYYLLADFGIAKIRQSAHRFTNTGAAIGTPHYISPEQIRQRGEIDGRSDLYSLGVVLYEMAVGRPPFEGGSAHSLYNQHLVELPPPPDRLNPQLPPRMVHVILKALSKDPDDRYSTARAMLVALSDSAPVVLDKATRFMEDTKPIFTPIKEDARPAEPTRGDEQPASPAASPADPIFVSRQSGQTGKEKSPIQRTIPPFQPGTSNTKELEATQKLDHSRAKPAVPPSGPVPSRVSPAKANGADRVARPLQPVAQEIGPVRPTKTGRESAPAFPAAQKPAEPSHQASTGLPFYRRKEVFVGTISVLLIAVIVVFTWIGYDLITTNQPASSSVAESLPTPENASGTAEEQQPTFVNVREESTQETPPAVAGQPEDQPGRVEPPGEDTTSAEQEIETLPEEPAPGDEPQEDGIQPEQEEAILEDVEVPIAEEPDMSLPVEPLPVPSISGRLAIPLLLGIEPKVYVVSVQGELVGSIGAARQPAYSPDYTRLIVNGDGGPLDKLRISDPVGQAAFEIGDPGLAGHAHPFWSPDGSRIVYDDDTIDPQGWRIYFRNLDNSQGEGMLLSSKAGPIYGQQPLWTTGDRFIFRACNTWAGRPGECGLWLMQGNQGDPVRLTSNINHIPTDVSGDLVVYTSAEAGDWNVYSLNIIDKTTTQLTSDPAAQGLGTISPDGRTVAFLSQQDEVLAVWYVPISGGSPQKMIDISGGWGVISPNAWSDDRLTWGAQ